MGLAVLTNPNTLEPITGSINGVKLTLDAPLPASTLVVGMYIRGAGVNPQTTFQSVVENDGSVTGVTLNQNLGIPTPHTQYAFSKVPNLFNTSGAMVFGNQGVFADAAVQFPPMGTDRQSWVTLKTRSSPL